MSKETCDLILIGLLICAFSYTGMLTLTLIGKKHENDKPSTYELREKIKEIKKINNR